MNISTRIANLEKRLARIEAASDFSSYMAGSSRGNLLAKAYKYTRWSYVRPPGRRPMYLLTMTKASNLYNQLLSKNPTIDTNGSLMLEAFGQENYFSVPKRLEFSELSRQLRIHLELLLERATNSKPTQLDFSITRLDWSGSIKITTTLDQPTQTFAGYLEIEELQNLLGRRFQKLTKARFFKDRSHIVSVQFVRSKNGWNRVDVSRHPDGTYRMDFLNLTPGKDALSKREADLAGWQLLGTFEKVTGIPVVARSPKVDRF